MAFPSLKRPYEEDQPDGSSPTAKRFRSDPLPSIKPLASEIPQNPLDQDAIKAKIEANRLAAIERKKAKMKERELAASPGLTKPTPEKKTQPTLQAFFARKASGSLLSPTSSSSSIGSPSTPVATVSALNRVPLIKSPSALDNTPSDPMEIDPPAVPRSLSGVFDKVAKSSSMKDSSSYFPPTSVGLEKSEAPNHSETLKLKEATDSATSWEALPARARLSKMDYKNEAFSLRPQKQKPLAARKMIEALEAEFKDSAGGEGQISEKRPPFLLPGRIRDKNMRRPGDPDYDPTTLYIPPEDYKNLTAAKQQYYDVKKNKFDHIVFFQQGDFYNIFGLDADVGVELGLVYNPNLDSVGVNRRDLDHWKAKFLGRGYKVTVMSQTTTAETALAKQKKKEELKKKKTEDREITEILTAGTIRDLELVTGHDFARYTLAITQACDGSASFGLVLIEVTTLEVCLCHFNDDDRLTCLETFLRRFPPKEIVYDRYALSQETLKMLRSFSQHEILFTQKKFPIFTEHDTSIASVQGITDLLAKNASASELTKAVVNPLVGSAFATLVAYLKEVLLTLDDIIPNVVFIQYDVRAPDKYLTIDAAALVNLELLENNDNFSSQGTLLEVLDHCVTPMGKRLLRRWIMHPLRDLKIIVARQKGIAALVEQPSIREIVKSGLAVIKDLERSFGAVRSARTTVTKLLDFLDALQHSVFVVNSIRKELQALSENGAPMEVNLLTMIAARFPDLKPFFDSLAFDRVDARKKGRIEPKAGSVPEYDEAVAKVRAVEEKLNDYLVQLRRATKVPQLKYDHNNSERYYIACPAGSLRGHQLHDLEPLKSTKSEDRYTSHQVQMLVEELDVAEDELKVVLSNVLGHYVNLIADHFDALNTAVNLIATLDVMLSLATYALSLGDGGYCLPEFVNSSTPILDIRGGRHPYVRVPTGSILIPNDVVLGMNAHQARLCLVTGPNMGGKSTVLRLSCILVILAQMGALVPATSMRLTLFDQIFTRLGARDLIFAGQSTFMLELNETSQILKRATKHSLVILDELGRGTSTFDGYSIAYAVIKAIQEKGCCCLFATHYHKLTDEFASDPTILLTHMDCHEEDGRMIFFYKLVEGACPKSYGLTVASMANLSPGIIERARVISNDLERKTNYKFDSATALLKVQRLATLVGVTSSTYQY